MVPDVEKKYGNMDMLHPELRHMVKIFTDSADNSLFKIEYSLQVFVKHQSKLEFGMGNFAEFPIKIKWRPQNLPWVPSQEQLWLEGQDIAEWAPQISYPMVSCRFEKSQEDGMLTPIVTASDGNNLTQMPPTTEQLQPVQSDNRMHEE